MEASARIALQHGHEFPWHPLKKKKSHHTLPQIHTKAAGRVVKISIADLSSRPRPLFKSHATVLPQQAICGRKIEKRLSLGGSRSGSGVLLSRGVGFLVLVSGRVDVVFLAGAVNGDLDRNGAAVNLLAVHLADSLGLELLRGQVHETEAASLAALVAGLKLLNHETGDGAESDLGGNGLEVLEDLLEL